MHCLTLKSELASGANYSSWPLVSTCCPPESEAKNYPKIVYCFCNDFQVL
jgi:hypothetical protein